MKLEKNSIKLKTGGVDLKNNPEQNSKNLHVSSQCFAYTPCPEKKEPIVFLGITSSDTGRFLKFFQCHNLLEICNKTVIKFPTTPQTRRYTNLWKTDVRKLACPERCGMSC